MPHHFKCFLKVYEDMVDLPLELEMFFAQGEKIEILLDGTSTLAKPGLGW